MVTSDSLLVFNGGHANFIDSTSEKWVGNYGGSGGNCFFSTSAFQGVIACITNFIYFMKEKSPGIFG
jgi:hypothetical protein